MLILVYAMYSYCIYALHIKGKAFITYCGAIRSAAATNSEESGCFVMSNNLEK